MDNKSRVSNTMRNLKIGMLMQIIGYILSFVNRTVFIYVIGTTYLGVNTLFANILTILSFTEAGAEAAFSSLLYKPLRDGNRAAVNMIMNAFRRTFTVIGIAVAAIGLALIPFLKLLSSEAAQNVENLTLIYILFLAGSVVNYLFTYKISLIKADQKTYIVSVYDEIIALIQYVLQIVVVLLTKNFVLYVAVQMALSVIRNFALSAKSSKMYPYIGRRSPPLPAKLKEHVARRIRGGLCLHTGMVITGGTDSIVITYFLGFHVNGLYANYLMITSIIGAFLKIAFDSIYASVGDLIAEGDRRKIYRYFRIITFASFLLFSVSTVGMYALFNPFINLWLGEGFAFPQLSVFLIVLVFLLGNYGIKRPLALFKNSCGLFYNDRYFALAEGICNLVLSLVLVKLMGFNGVMLGTILSSLITLVSGAYVLYKNLFKRSILCFFFRLAEYVLFTAALGALMGFAVSRIGCPNWFVFILEGILCVAVVGVSVILVFGRKPEFRFMRNFVLARVPKRFLPAKVYESVHREKPRP